MNRYLAISVFFGLCLLAASAVFAVSSFISINELGRNPSGAASIFTRMIITLVITQGVAVGAMLIVFELLSAK